ncbi:MAG TPA: DUF1800 domain-containing protein [Candidatus Acidoferrales bacterium]|nr:DUF1800 domain-containing protein [Candidatus Acidoferrales bacterium]
MPDGLSDEQKIAHFLNRVTFGATVGDLREVQRLGIEGYLEQQLHPETIADSLVETKLASLKTLRLTSRELLELYPPPKEAQAMPSAGMQGPRFVIFELQRSRLLRAVYSQRQLFEMMVDFWTNHFNVFAGKGADRWLITSYDRDTIRPHALGRFRDLLVATAQSPAMLFYLDNWLSVGREFSQLRPSRNAPTNRRAGLNENYARELLELHTLGVDGGYSQKDVEETARAFTGWTIRRPRGEAVFYFAPRMHDPGEKTVLGVKIPPGGMDEGLQVIDLLARHPSTARFISAKLARRFVADNPPASLVARAAAVFRQTDGDIREVLRAILTAPEFFSRENVHSKVKKPLEFVASALRISGAETDAAPPLLRLLARMGEPLFLAFPPTGFPDAARSWTSPDGLLIRINFIFDLLNNRIAGTRVGAGDLAADDETLARLVAPAGLTPTTRAALARGAGADRYALLLAAPEFQRR